VIVLLINPNRLRPRVPPIGLDYLNDSLVRQGHVVLLFDFGIQPPGKLINLIQTEDPDIIGISVRNLDDVNLVRKREFVTPIKKLILSVRRVSNAKVVLGGIGFSFMPHALMEETGADFGIVGDGESAFPRLLENLNTPGNVPGLLYKSNTGDVPVRQTEPFPCSVHELPVFQRSLVDYKKYRQKGGFFNIQTKRGCNHHCIYCPEPEITGRRIRTRPPESVIEELKILTSYGIRDRIFFVDSEFNIMRDHAHAVAEAIYDSGLQIRWCCSMTPANADLALLQMMKKAGCNMIIWSVDSASEKMLHRLGKGFSVSDMMNATQYCNAIDLPYCLVLLFGGPGESFRTIDESCRNLAGNRAGFIAVSAGIRIYPKTALYNISIEEHEISGATNLLYPVYYKHDRVKNDFLPYIGEKFLTLQNCVMHGRVPDGALQKEINRVYPVYNH
jgi:radical SAM superfamily enzyme YgiQ (UPF0313 family)